ncbi:TIGR03915 family putative DNA repair protein [Alkalibacter mobilis]|uniref:TIGR03915 family putative DNA repair protein n=1 Tax=Alkalibacter mobilis TaxID=2787712 RepID=UPI00189FE39A|nr:TIGR03915 family putative DNA repair protein [Alkalibacter mobilis]MBF7096444.1 TIGR03915 family putative DNA repair protein [Alkalibacter mobilis]
MTDYLYDGTFEGFLTCLYCHFAHEPASTIAESGFYQMGWSSTCKTIKTNEKEAEYMYKKLYRHLGLQTSKDVYYSYLSQVYGWEDITLSFVDLCFREGAKFKDAHSHDRVYPFESLVLKVKREVHRYEGFVRFRQIGYTLYAKIHPEYFILPAISDHFTDRFRNEKIIIHDERRNLALIAHDGDSLLIPYSKSMQEKDLPEDPFILLWKKYVKTIAIESRINPKLQQKFIPLKYRKDLVEMENQKELP